MTILKRSLLPVSGFAGIMLAATLAACGGGGGGSSPAPPAPTAAPAPVIAGVAAVGGIPLANASIVFSCGCTGQAGTTKADASGNYTLTVSSTAAPSTPDPTYTTIPGRNYLAVMTANGQEAWDIAFLGSTPSHNHILNQTNTSDKYTTAAALYVFYNSINLAKPDAFDSWDFSTIASWVTTLKSSPLAEETTLLSDIETEQTAGVSLYPSTGAEWAPAGTVANGKIKIDLDNVKAAATAAGLATRLPQQCGDGTAPCAVPTP